MEDTDFVGANDETTAPGELTYPAEIETPEIRLGSGSALTLVSKLVGLGTSFFVGILVARMFGTEGKGTLSIIMMVPGILVIVLDLGLATSTILFVSRGELKPRMAAGNALLISAVLGVLGAPIIYVLLYSPYALIPHVPIWATVIAVSILPLGLLSGWLGAISTGLSNLVLPLWYTIASSLTTLIGLAILLATGHGSLTGVLAMSVAGTVAGIIVFFVGLRRSVRPLGVNPRVVRSMARFSAKAYLSSIAGLLHERQDMLLLGWLVGASAVGLYSVGVSFAELTWYIPGALSAAILAKGSRRGEESAVDYTTRTSRIAVVFMLGTLLVSSVAIPLLIPLLYGRAFAPAIWAFFALLPGVLADGVSRILWSYQITRGRMYWRLAVGTMALNFLVVLALVPSLGAVGASLASTVSYSVLAVFVVRHFCKDTGATVAAVLVPQRADVQIILRTSKRLLSGGRTAR